MSEVLELKTIHDYNEFLGLETLNPLVGIVDFSKVKVLPHRRKVGTFYAIFLKEKVHGPITYGRGKYDYQEGTLVFVGPGQVAGIDDGGVTENPQGYALLFHPDLIRGTSLGKRMKELLTNCLKRMSRDSSAVLRLVRMKGVRTPETKERKKTLDELKREAARIPIVDKTADLFSGLIVDVLESKQ